MNLMFLWNQFKGILTNKPEEVVEIFMSIGIHEADASSLVKGLKSVGVLDLLSLKHKYQNTKVSDVDGVRDILEHLKLDSFIRAEDISHLMTLSSETGDFSLSDWISSGGYRTLYENLVAKSGPFALPNDVAIDLVVCNTCSSSVPQADFCSECGTPL